LLALLGCSSAAVFAGVDYSIPRWTVDGGGGAVSGGVFELRATLGQPDVGSASGGVYAVNGGFWASQSAPVDASGIFADGFESTP
jgi:hypothetical protein